MKCPQCGTEVEEQYNFCPQCQAKLRPDAPEAARPEAPSAPETPSDPGLGGQAPGSGQNPSGGQSAGGAYVPPQYQSRPQRYGPQPGTAYDYFTEKNRSAAQAAGGQGPQGSAPGTRPSSPYPTVNYQPPQKHTGLIVAIVVVAVIVIISLFVGLFTIIRWAEYHYEDEYYQHHYDWSDEYWDTTGVQKASVSLPGGFHVTFPDN